MLAKLIKNKYLLIIITAWLTGLVSHNALAMDSANYKIYGDILNGGGLNGSYSTNYSLTDSIGEPVAGSHDLGANSGLESGFLEENNNVLLASVTSSESFINATNQTAFNIQCVGVTDNEADQTITCEGSFDQNNWYTINTQASPVNDITIAGIPDISGWTDYPADGATTIYVRAQDGYNSSTARSLGITKDLLAPTTTASVFSGTLGTNNWYTTDVDMTTAPIDATSGVAVTNYCVDQTDTCIPTTIYSVPVTISTEGTNYFRYFSVDNAGNVQTVQSEEVKIDKTSPTTAPICLPADNTYFKVNLSITCTTGVGGTSIRYTDDSSEPDQSSPAWTDQIVTTSSNFKFISCDEANNCYPTSSNYNYNQDNTPPPIPVMNAEPIYTMDLDNTVSAVAVVDGGVGGVSYQFCINETDSTTGCTESEWVTDPAYNFSELHDAQIYYYFVRSKDSLDNISDWSSSVFSTQNNQTGNYYYYLENDATANAIINNDLVGWWDFEEYEGAIAYDRSGLINNGEYIGTSIITGQLLQARSFNGSSDYIDLGKNITTKNQAQRTIETWINVNSLSNYSPIYYESIAGDGTVARLILTVETDGSVKLAGRDSDSVGPLVTFAQTAAGEIATGNWYHVVAIYDADTDNHRIVINNINKTVSITDSSTFPNTDPAGDIRLGADSTTYSAFILDETRIYDVVLSDTQIQNEYIKRITDNPYIDDYSYTEGIHYFHIRPRSNSYLWGVERIYEIDYDATAPTIDAIVSVAGDTSAPYFDTTDDGNTLVIYTSSDNLNSVAQCKWSETDQTLADMPNTCTDNNNCTLNLTGEGAKTVYFRCQDSINNDATSSFVLNYTIDSAPPQVTAITSVASDTTLPYKDGTDDGNTAVVYTASADAVACRWSEADLTYEAMVNTCTDTSNCALNLTGDGDKTVFMRCIDAAGLSSTSSYTLNYTIDTTPPAITAITSVATDTNSPYYDTTDDSATQILFTTSADTAECKWSTTDQTYDSMPNTCSAVGDCTTDLAGQGAKTIFIRCKDDMENKMTTSQQVDYTIDSIAPSVLAITSVANDFIAPYLDTTIPYGQTPVIYTASADATTCKWDYSNKDYDSMANTCASTNSCTITHSGDGGKNIFFRCMDEAGNKSPNSYELDFEVDENITGGGIRTEESSSAPSDPTNLLITFTSDLTTPAAVNGSVRIRLDSEYDLSALTHEDVFGAGGDVMWTDNELIYPDNNIITFPFTGSLNNDDGQISLTIGNLETINPGGTGSYFVSYNIFDNPAGTGTALEDGDGLVHLNYIVIVTASVPSFLDFSINPVASGQPVNGAMTNITTTNGQAVNFGSYTAADDRIAAHDIVVSTNAASGYIVSIEYDQSLSSGSNFIPDFPATNDNPTTWIAPPGSGTEGYFGYTTTDASLLNTPNDRFAGGKWSGFDTIPWEVIYDNQTVQNQTTRIGYRLQLTNSQSLGAYSNQIMYIITPTF